MTEKTQPTDAEILDAADDFRSQYKHGGTTFDEFAALDFARAVLAKWGTPATGGEPAGTVGYTVHGTQYVNWRTKPPAHGTPLYTTPQPTQAQAGAVTDAQVLAAVRVVSPGLFRHGLQPLPNDGANTAAQMRKEADTVRKMLEAANGIKGGQHGT